MKIEFLVLCSVLCMLRMVLYVEALPQIRHHYKKRDLLPDADCIPLNNQLFVKCATTNVGIWADFICDGQDDCGDNSDEINCGRQILPTESCTAEEYQCLDKAHCIPKEEFCDGIQNCKYGSDEYEGCQKDKKTCTGFKCQDDQCVDTKERACNGIVDCNDKSDEFNCTTSFPLMINTTIVPANCSDDMFLCDDGKCILFSKSCDGRDDCGDNSDESNAKCNESVGDRGKQNPVQQRGVSWTAPMAFNFSSNFSNESPHLTFNFFFKK